MGTQMANSLFEGTAARKLESEQVSSTAIIPFNPASSNASAPTVSKKGTRFRIALYHAALDTGLVDTVATLRHGTIAGVSFNRFSVPQTLVLTIATTVIAFAALLLPLA